MLGTIFFFSFSPEIRKDKKTRKSLGFNELGLIGRAYKKSACSHSFPFSLQCSLCVSVGVRSQALLTADI